MPKNGHIRLRPDTLCTFPAPQRSAFLGDEFRGAYVGRDRVAVRRLAPGAVVPAPGPQLVQQIGKVRCVSTPVCFAVPVRGLSNVFALLLAAWAMPNVEAVNAGGDGGGACGVRPLPCGGGRASAVRPDGARQLRPPGGPFRRLGELYMLVIIY